MNVLNFHQSLRIIENLIPGARKATASPPPLASLTTRMFLEEVFLATQNRPILTRILPRTVQVVSLHTLERGSWQKTGWLFLKTFHRQTHLSTCSARGRSLAKNLTSSRSSSQFSEERGPARNWNAAKNAGSIVKSSGNTFRSINDK